MILRNKTNYFAVKIFEFSGLNDKILDKIRAVLEPKFFIDENLDSFLASLLQFQYAQKSCAFWKDLF